MSTVGRARMAEHAATPKIGDVARAAGVSVPTVSRVLNGTTPVSERLQRRVHDAITALGYRPNSAARALALGRRSMVAVVAGNASRYGWARTIQGIEVAARRSGYSAVVSVVESAEPEDVEAAVDLVLAENVAGVIVLEFDEPGRAVLRRLPATIPVVAVSGGYRGRGAIPHAMLDEQTPARKLTEHLLSLGHATVYHVSQPTMGRPLARMAGWKAALQAAGAPVPPVLHASWEPRTAYAAGERLLEIGGVTAVFCANDDIALAVMRAFDDHGVNVPTDIAVFGFDDQPMAEFLRPSLSTVRQDFDDLGARAFNLFLATREGKRPSHSVVTPELILRESTAKDL